jgi:hypothetical protein
MISSPFLTDLDSRAAVKGSRDPLGIQGVWTRFGRHVVGNLSTVSNSVRDFTVLLLGYHFAAHVADQNGPESQLGTFLKWEQLAGYARGRVNKDWSFRGTERARQRVDELNTITLSAQSKHQLLSNQKLYGLWGLYTVPGRASGLLDGDPVRLKPLALKFVEELYLSMLTEEGFRDGKAIVEILSEENYSLNVDGKDKRLLKAVARVLQPRFLAREREFYRKHLLYGGSEDSTNGRQRQLVELLEPKLSGSDFDWSPPKVVALAKEAEKRGQDWLPLARYLRRISQVESVMAPTSMLFTHLLGCEGTKIDEIAKRVRNKWGAKVTSVAVEALPDLQPELAGDDVATGQRWLEIGQFLSNGDYAPLIRRMLEQNRSVMQTRGGASAWVEEQNQRLRVRMNEERGELPERERLPTLWRFPYFLNSLASVAFQLKEGDHG